MKLVFLFSFHIYIYIENERKFYLDEYFFLIGYLDEWSRTESLHFLPKWVEP